MPQGTIVYLIRTYQGYLTDENYQKNIDLYEMIMKNLQPYKVTKIGTDKYAEIKNKLPGGRPKIDAVQIYVISGRLKNDFLIQPQR